MLLIFAIIETVKASLVHGAAVVPAEAPFTGAYTGTALVLNALLLQSFSLIDHLTWNVPSWSIAAEFWTYAVFGVATRSAPPRLRLPAYVLLAALGAVAVIAFSRHYIDTTYDYGFLRCLYGFFTGCLTYRLWRSARFDPRFANVVEAFVVAGIAVFVMFSLGRAWSDLAPVAFAAAVWVFAQEAGFVSRLLRTTPFARLGAWSYSIYMLHMLVVVLLGRLAVVIEHLIGQKLVILYVPPLGETARRVIAYPNLWLMDGVVLAYLAAVIAAAAPTYRMVERPGQRFFNRAAARMAAPAAPVRLVAPAETTRAADSARANRSRSG